jgi:hypothetical protein
VIIRPATVSTIFSGRAKTKKGDKFSCRLFSFFNCRARL